MEQKVSFSLGFLRAVYQERDLDAKCPHALDLSCERLHQGEMSK